MKKIFIVIVLFTLVTLSGGCTKDGETNVTAYLLNNSGHQIEIYYYNKGVVNVNDTLKVGASQKVYYGESYGRGIWSGATCSFKYRGDSAIIIYDNSYKITHLWSGFSSSNSKCYLFDNIRNVFNPKNFNSVYNDVSNYSREFTLTFTFTEQDYLDAKQ